MPRIFIFFFTILLFSRCARVGSPTGGEKDITPPKVIKSSPKNKSINFSGKEVRIYFDEFIQLKDINKNLLITPPQKNLPEISPLGTAAKEIRIKFKDSLLPNTTYVINFGESIVDFNEGNKMENYQFIFSTGKQIDSLYLKGKVKPLHFSKKPENIIVGLYPIDKFKDSLIYKEPPYYVAKVNKHGDFKFNYLKKGEYKLIALADQVRNYVYNPEKEAIGFIKKKISIPNDTLVEVDLFKEPGKFALDELKQISRNHIHAKYKGEADSLKFEFLSPFSDSLVIVDSQKRDLWYKSQSDSLKIKFIVGKYQKILKGKREAKKDSLNVFLNSKITFHPLDSLKIYGNIPLIEVDKKKIKLWKDSIPLNIDLKWLPKKEILIVFDPIPGATYQLQILPQAVTDFLGNKNRDTIQRSFSIPEANQFGKMYLDLPDIKDYYFVEVLDSNKKIIRKSHTSLNNKVHFDYLKPGKYYIRIVFDSNKNNQWDTGNYLKHLLPEKIIELSTPIEIRANWDINQKIKI